MKERSDFSVKRILRRICILLMCICITASALSLETFAASDIPYTSYNYNYWDDYVYTPDPYEPVNSISGEGLLFNNSPLGAFNNPSDMCVSNDGNIYICDSGNNRIVVMDNSLGNVIDVITDFSNEGVTDSFSSPMGLAISNDNELYVADSQNNRVVVLDKDKNVVRIIDNPKSESLEEGFSFVPLRVSVDYANRVYVIARNVFEGIMVFETDGSFAGFFGTINVKISLWDRFWRKLASKEERENSRLFIPTEFTGIDVDTDGFVYASNIDSAGEQGVRRLNPKGQDVIKKGIKGKLCGDLRYSGDSEYDGPSQFSDVVYRGNGIYSCLDRKRGRIFTYDHEGNLLYIFGGPGNSMGTFKMATSIEEINGNLMVLDSIAGKLTYFKATKYGRLINDAVSLRYEGDEKKAVELWEQVLMLDENNELACTGIGKAYLTKGDYVNAMKYLRLGYAKAYYSVAFKRFRNGILRANANYILTGLLTVIVILIAVKKMKTKKEAVREEEAEPLSEEEYFHRTGITDKPLKNLFYTLSHPMDGYYWLRHKDKGSVRLSFILVVFFSFSYSLNRLMAGFIVNAVDERYVNSLYELLGILIFYVLVAASNWSVTSLMGGEGRFKDILVVIGYSTLPISISIVTTTLFSNVLAENEEAFYYLILGIGIAYGLIIMLMGLMKIHNYSLTKAVLTVLLTFVAFIIIVFLIMLLINLIGMIFSFIRSVYTEIIFRA